jgi:hypothetical protein
MMMDGDVYYRPDQIIVTAGDIIEFRRRRLKIFNYFHFAVCTVNSVADRPEAIVDQHGDRYSKTQQKWNNSCQEDLSPFYFDCHLVVRLAELP